jgi:hypothetical protein
MSAARRLGVLAAFATLAAFGGVVPSGVGVERPDVDPAALPRGDGPAVTHLVGDTIRDGALRVSATHGQHIALWNTVRGYVVQDAARGGRTRLVHVTPSGERTVLTRRAEFTVAVSRNGRWLTWDSFVGPVEGPPSRVTVVDLRTGRVQASRTFASGAHVVAVTGRRVMLARLSAPRTNGTLWWDYERDTLRRYYTLSAIRVDRVNDRVVFDIPRDAPACNRVALFSEPSRELWRSCRWYPAGWSPDGRYAVSTYTYFDAPGTERWRVVDGRTGERVARVTGRLDWHAVWEDERHFLTMAMNPEGQAAVIRCDVDATCERASRVWDLSPKSYDFYLAPPVVLASS